MPATPPISRPGVPWFKARRSPQPVADRPQRSSAAAQTARRGVQGRYGNQLGTITVSSQMARLPVVEKFVSFEFQAATVEQGKETDLVIKVTKLGDFEGEAEVTLLGLPNKVTTEPKKITKIRGAGLPPHDRQGVARGNHPNLVCQAVILKDGERWCTVWAPPPPDRRTAPG